MTDELREFIRANSSGDILYGCRVYGPEHAGLRGAQVLTCERCGTRIIATPSVLNDRRKVARQLGRALVVICDDCLLAAARDDDRPLIAEFPDAHDLAEAEKMHR